MQYSNYGRPGKNDVFIAPAMLIIIGMCILGATIASIPGSIDSPWDFLQGDPPYWVYGCSGFACVLMGVALLLLHFKREYAGERLVVVAAVQFALVALWVTVDHLSF